jgi:SNF2 family DNA or RNA helicase
MQATATLTPRGTIRLQAEMADSVFIREIPGRMWNQQGRYWELPCTQESLVALNRALPLCEVSAEAERAANSVVQWLRDVAAARNHTADHWPDHINVTPYQHQMQALQVGEAVLEGSEGFALWHEVGLGKTLTTLALLEGLPYLRTLVVCPASVIGGWVKEIERHAPDFDAVPLTGPTTKRASKVLEARNGNIVFITNWEALRRPELLAALCDTVNVMVADEAHKLKNPASAQSKAARAIGEHCAYRIALTGTPNDGTYLSIYGIYRWLDKTIFGTSQTAHRARYFHEVAIPGGVKIVTGVKQDMLPEMLSKMHSIAHSCSKAEALDLPEAVHVDRCCELEPAAMKAYASMKKEAIALLDDGSVTIAPSVLTRILRLRQIAGGFIEGTKVSTAKQKLLTETLDDILQQQDKVIIFAMFRDEIDAILESLTVKHCLLDGRVPPGSKRDAVLEQFEHDPDTRVIVIQTTAGGVGINLQFCSTSILYSWDHSLINWLQLHGRTDRIGQTVCPTYIRLIAQHTTDQTILDALDAKEDVSKYSTFQWKKVLA